LGFSARIGTDSTWDVPNGRGTWSNPFTRGLLDGWQLSGDTGIVSGDWAGVTISITDNFDFRGGDGGTSGDVGGGGRTVRPTITGDPICHSNCDPTPGGTGRYLNVAAFSRPAGRSDYGNAARTFFRMPPIVLSNMAIFKNFQLGGGRRLQFRWEAYNVFNQVNWSTLNTTAQFNPAGEQVNANFGQATAARPARVMQGAMRSTF
jgi:hypothetical protein